MGWGGGGDLFLIMTKYEKEKESNEKRLFLKIILMNIFQHFCKFRMKLFKWYLTE